VRFLASLGMTTDSDLAREANRNTAMMAVSQAGAPLPAGGAGCEPCSARQACMPELRQPRDLAREMN